MTNKFTILIILVLLAMLGAYGLSRQPTPADTDNSASDDEKSSTQEKGAANQPAKTLEDAREQVRQRLANFEQMSPEEWNEELKTHPRRRGSLEDAIKHAKEHLAKLESMTPMEYDARLNGGDIHQTKVKARDLPTLGPRPSKNAGVIAPTPQH